MKPDTTAIKEKDWKDHELDQIWHHGIKPLTADIPEEKYDLLSYVEIKMDEAITRTLKAHNSSLIQQIEKKRSRSGAYNMALDDILSLINVPEIPDNSKKPKLLDKSFIQTAKKADEVWEEEQPWRPSDKEEKIKHGILCGCDADETMKHFTCAHWACQECSPAKKKVYFDHLRSPEKPKEERE